MHDAHTPETNSSDPFESGHDWRLGRFPKLMTHRVQEILLVSSAYDSYILEEDGLLSEMIYSEYADLGLTNAPNVTRVSSGSEALERVRSHRFDLVISMVRLGNMDVEHFCRAVHDYQPELPIALMIASEWELARTLEIGDRLQVDGIYVWHGDTKIFLAIIKLLEDRWNAEHDTEVGDVGVVILVEDSVRFRSSLLPIMYSELVKQTRAVMADGINRMHKLMRLRARPKVLTAETFEEGLSLYDRFQEHLFGVIADVEFPRDGTLNPSAGFDFIREVKSRVPDMPTLLQSSDAGNRSLAESIGADFLHKRSNTLLEDVREFMLDNFGFGDFIFRMPDRREVARASDLRTMTNLLQHVPAESLEYHATRNHFSNWLRARTEFALARGLRPRQVSEFRDLESLRRYLVRAFQEALRQNRRGVVEDFTRETFDSGSRFARIGGGSLGGKARGVAFLDALLARFGLDREFEGVHIHVPRSVVIGTAVFDQFLEENRLRLLALRTDNDDWIRWAFLTAKLPDYVRADLQAYLDIVRVPIAVRSSSLLEDSQHHPFAGVYATHMIANNHPDDNVRLAQLTDAIKLVYASTFYHAARRYLGSTPHRIEEEKMAVIVQPVVGSQHEQYFYPSFAGVALSYNYYPFGHMKPTDGVASVVLGLGTTVVEGGRALRFSPAHPQVIPELADGRNYLSASQRDFFAIDLSRMTEGPGNEEYANLVTLGLDAAEQHGTLAPVGSVWSNENQCFYDGIYRKGARAVTFAHVLKHDVFPLAPILKRLLDLGRQGMNTAIEIEFAVDLTTDPKQFAVLQIRPCEVCGASEPVDLKEVPQPRVLVHSRQALGNGRMTGVQDVVYVKPEAFDAQQTPRIATEIGALNDLLIDANRPCLLIGPGRWGSSNRTLGIPVKWGHISAARVIVETALEHFRPDPSQGSHFFHNLTSFGIAYLTVDAENDRGRIDWEWLAAQPAEEETEFVRLVRLDGSLEARVDGRISEGYVLKPE